MMREELAAVQHEIWAHWMEYLFSKSVEIGDGSCVIPSGLAKRWKRQIETSYADLTEQEKESDREQADKVLAVENEKLNKLRSALANLVGAETEEDLRGMRTVLRMMPVPDGERENIMNAIEVLMETLPHEE